MARILAALALISTPFLAVAAADAGGWTRFLVGLIFAIVGGTYLVRELRADPGRNQP